MNIKVRALSAVVALLICIPIIIYGGIPFYLGLAVIGLIGFMEFLNLRSKNKKIPYIMKIFGVISFVVLMMNNWDVWGSLNIFDYEKTVLVIFLMLIPIIFFYKSKKYDVDDALFLLGGIIFLGIGFNQLAIVRNTGLSYLVFLLLITIFTDTFAYIIGSLIGKYKMCPSVSPNKSWEGFIGGLVLGTFVSTVFYVTTFDYTGNIFILILIVLILSIIGQLGDLVFSAIKRSYNIKDYGNIMPGHGGVLDRLDSILFVVMAFSFLSKFL